MDFKWIPLSNLCSAAFIYQEKGIADISAVWCQIKVNYTPSLFSFFEDNIILYISLLRPPSVLSINDPNKRCLCGTTANLWPVVFFSLVSIDCLSAIIIEFSSIITSICKGFFSGYMFVFHLNGQLVSVPRLAHLTSGKGTGRCTKCREFLYYWFDSKRLNCTLFEASVCTFSITSGITDTFRDHRKIHSSKGEHQPLYGWRGSDALRLCTRSFFVLHWPLINTRESARNFPADPVANKSNSPRL